MVATPCKECHGRGVTRQIRELKLHVPAGVDDGSRLRLRGEGEPGQNGGPPGDLYVILRVEPDKVFERQGQNLILRADISFVQAALGHKIEVPTLTDNETMGLGEALDIALDNLQLTLEQTGAIVHRPENLPTVTADVAQIGQLFQNLIGNALKYRNEAIAPEVTITAKRLEDAWEIAVADNGIGIAPQHFDRVFRMARPVGNEGFCRPGFGNGSVACHRSADRSWPTF